MKTKRKKIKRKKTFKRKKSQKGGSQRSNKRRRVEQGENQLFQNLYTSGCHIDSDDLPHRYNQTRMVRGGWRIPFVSPHIQQNFVVDPIQDETLRNIRDYNIRNCIIHKVRLNDDGSTESIKIPELIPLGGQRTIIEPWSPDNDLLSEQYIFAIPYNEHKKLYYFSLDEGEATYKCRNIFIITNSSGHYIPKWNEYSIDLIKRFFHNVNDRLVIVNNRTEEGNFHLGYQYLHGDDLFDEEFKRIIRGRL